MKLKKLIKDLEIEVFSGNKDLEIGGICSHSKKICPKDLFIARKGKHFNASEFIHEAVQIGAIAVLAEEGDPFLQDVTQLIHPNVEALEPVLASRFYENPSAELFTVGVTGTNGKTTVTYLLKHLLSRSGLKTGLIGTVEYCIGDISYPSDRTTPDPISLHKLFREMRNNGCEAAVMEVSSHALAQKRTEGVDFDAAIFTNLSQDHLDFHETMENYFLEKAKLFTSLSREKWAIINNSCPYGRKLAHQAAGQILTYGFEEDSLLRAQEVKPSIGKTCFLASYKNESIPFEIPLMGEYNVLNVLAAAAVLLTRGIPLEKIASLCKDFKGVSGRLEKVENEAGLKIYIDYAVTPDALANVCRALSSVKKEGRLIVVFGCGGERDMGKRPLMGAIASRLADLAIVTTDNPRSEDPLKICQEILSGADKTNTLLILDRKLAIQRAIAEAKKKDLILIAGKGHETYQIFAHQITPFEDKKVVQSLIREMVTVHGGRENVVGRAL